MIKKGVGLASKIYACGYGFGRPDSASAILELEEDGSATLLTGCAEIGQGSDTALVQIAAQETGLKYEDINVISADTTITPDSGASTASRQTYVSGNAVRKAASEVKNSLLEIAEEKLKVEKNQITFSDGEVFVDNKKVDLSVKELAYICRRSGGKYIGWGRHNITTPDVDPETNQGDAYATYIYATHLAEIEVDTETGHVKVLNIIASHDVGHAINPQLIEGQVEGACSMGLGYALMEEVIKVDGEIKTPTFTEYLIPTAKDMPNIETIIVEDHDPTGPFGAKGVGEGATIPTAPAIINAIYDAVGVRITKLPATADKILDGLNKLQN